ncbi:PREDICTED: classical arabinogalactan protein 1 [Nelumbo nucifera]|uniref:Uncharacterized protein n=2 Tax=Nelumbo nucifera TaxID=4432 RepID=A0A822Y8U1_NELNU|nr:PREDICTED: classical arabinogalactan protein 1 [Nelumbo nucifera]DAD27991.1 TPA_asm: hypothetical protein HUJ06_029459 [Nelumbo nucifera]
MAKLVTLSFSMLLLLLFADFTVSQDPPQFSPVPAPQSGDVVPSPIPLSPHSGAPSPAPSVLLLPPPPDVSSPPAPPPSDQASDSSPTLSPASSPVDASDINHKIEDMAATSEESTGSSGGLKGGQKAGIAIGVILGACAVGFVGFVYKKRRDNIRRSQYGYAARTELL